MRAKHISIAILLTSRYLTAQISFEPQPVEDRFAQAPSVCRGLVVALVKQPPGWQERNGKLIPVDYSATVEREALYKGHSVADRFVIFMPQIQQTSGPPLTIGSRYVFFLEPGEGKSPMRLSAMPGAVMDLGQLYPSKPPDLRGVERIQTDIIGSPSNQEQTVTALSLLTQFRELSPGTIQLLQAIPDKDPETNVLRLLLLARSDPQKHFSDLAAALQTWASSHRSLEIATPLAGIVMTETANMLRRPRSAKDLPALEQLSTLENPAIRRSAMTGIRRLKDRNSIPFLIKQLEFPGDTSTQYSALITLAEITGKSGDFGPNVGLFERNPKMYINIWKQWWSEQSHH